MATNTFDAEARARLNVFFAGANALPTELQGPAVREYLERGLARLRAIEEQHYDYLAECALLAANNVQDVRLYDLERRVTAIENPETSWGEVFLAVAFNVAIGIAALAAWELAVVAALAVAGRAVAFQAARSAVRSYLPNAKNQELLMRFDGTSRRLSAIDQARQDLALISGRLSSGDVPANGFAISTFPDGSRAMRVQNLREWDRASRLVAVQRASVQSELQLLNRSLPLNSTAAAREMDKAVANSGAVGDAAVDRWSKDWREFIGGERGGLVVEPVTSMLEQARNELLRAPQDATVPGLPITSEISGRFLDWVRESRMNAVDEYTQWQLYVRYTVDADLKKDMRCAALGQIVTQCLPELEAQRGLAAAARSTIVIGFEAAFWLEILRGNGYLTVKPGVKELGPKGSKIGEYVRGAIRRTDQGPSDDFLHLASAFTLHVFEVDLYVGVALMTEFQATYLFHRYAKPWFADNANLAAANLPFDYVPAAYAQLVAEAPRLWEGQLSASEREKRLDEMKLLVIVFFRALLGGGVHARLAPYLKTGLGEAVTARLGNLPEGDVPDPTDNAVATLNALGTQREPMRALFAAVGASAQDEFRLAALAFAAQLITVEQDIQAWQLLSSGEIEQLGTGVYRDAEDLLEAICRGRDEVAVQYAQLEQMARDDPQSSTWPLVQTFDARRAALATWIAGDTDQCWQFESEPEPEPLPQ